MKYKKKKRHTNNEFIDVIKHEICRLKFGTRRCGQRHPIPALRVELYIPWTKFSLARLISSTPKNELATFNLPNTVQPRGSGEKESRKL